MLAFYRRHWFDVGGILLVIGGCILSFVWKELSTVQLLLTAMWFAQLLHNIEEYRWPGYLPGQMNVGMFNSDTPDRYPFNTNSAMIINTLFAYPVYVLPIFFPNLIWLGLGPVLIAFAQIPSHTILPIRKLKVRYSPGIITCVFLHLPIGILYVRQILAEGLVHPIDWLYSAIYAVFIGLVLVQGPIRLFRDKNTPYRFTARQAQDGRTLSR
ncbi:MAG: HXXEE domain-containing protein [Desulfatitalea sp.]|nr:HXXEE domain-containing protein [Desulfatitalea sp.]NNJ99249.1 HXXEE domain-containing protein [Desulfatitalea sp.]